MPLSANTRLGPYEILAPLGAGGMGEVYRAHDPRLGRDVALKVLPESVARHPDRLARFEREARTAATLNHPNIVTIHSIEEAHGTRFITMELVEGQTLDRAVAAAGLSLSRAVEVAIAIADALAAAHDKGIVHRDLKPGNVMVTREGRPKVLDFGLAKLAGPDFSIEGTQAMTLESPVSSAGQVLGTAPYMAPEQVRGEPVDARADLFALGVMLYELLAGRRPFAGSNLADVTSSILRDDPAPLLELRADLPRDLERIVGRCLEKDRERRFQTAKDVRNELELVRRDLSPTTPAGGRAAPGSSGPHPPSGAPAAPSETPSVAVLPFTNRSRDADDEYFSDGLADELLNVLSKIRGLRVAARMSSFSFKGKNATLEEVGRSLHVASVLEGSVRKAGNRVRITVQLVKVAGGDALWSETYDRTLDDIFAVQDDIAQAVVKELRTTLMGESADSRASGEARAEIAAAAKGRGANPEAHRLYLQARYLAHRLTADDIAKAARYLEEVLVLEPGFALARVELAKALLLASGWGSLPVDEAYARARVEVTRAIAEEPDLAEAHSTFGRILATHDFDWKGAREAYGRALELAPANADVLLGAGNLAIALGPLEDAVDLLRRSVELDPLSSIRYSTLGHAYRMQGRFVEAETAFRKAIELAPQRLAAHMVLSLVLLQQGRLAESLAEAEREPSEWARLTALGVIHHAAGRAAESDEALRGLEAGHASTSAYQIAQVHAFRGNHDAAFEWLERARVSRDPGMVWVQYEILSDRLHDDPRWKPFLRRMGFEV